LENHARRPDLSHCDVFVFLDSPPLGPLSLSFPSLSYLVVIIVLSFLLSGQQQHSPGKTRMDGCPGSWGKCAVLACHFCGAAGAIHVGEGMRVDGGGYSRQYALTEEGLVIELICLLVVFMSEFEPGKGGFSKQPCRKLVQRGLAVCDSYGSRGDVLGSQEWVGSVGPWSLWTML
jgi:hypothetical protein